MGQLPCSSGQKHPRPHWLRLGEHRLHRHRETAIANPERPIQRSPATVEDQHDACAWLDRAPQRLNEAVDPDVVERLVGGRHIGHDRRNEAGTAVAVDRAGHRQIDEDHVVARTARPRLGSGRRESLDDLGAMF